MLRPHTLGVGLDWICCCSSIEQEAAAAGCRSRSWAAAAGGGCFWVVGSRRGGLSTTTSRLRLLHEPGFPKQPTVVKKPLSGVVGSRRSRTAARRVSCCVASADELWLHHHDDVFCLRHRRRCSVPCQGPPLPPSRPLLTSMRSPGGRSCAPWHPCACQPAASRQQKRTACCWYAKPWA